MPEAGPIERLIEGGLLRRDGARLRTTRRWRAAMARAAVRLKQAGAPWTGLRLPVVAALVDLHPEAGDEALADLVEAMLPVEEQELTPLLTHPPWRRP
jgi:hypothetical protein